MGVMQRTEHPLMVMAIVMVEFVLCYKVTGNTTQYSATVSAYKVPV